MTQKQRIDELEKLVQTLQTRIVALEARPAYYPYPYAGTWWQGTTTWGPNGGTFSSSI